MSHGQKVMRGSGSLWIMNQTLIRRFTSRITNHRQTEIEFPDQNGQVDMSDFNQKLITAIHSPPPKES